jgi:uncharacterized protein YjeT (DUF2065 family)
MVGSILSALGLVLVIEGLTYALVPRQLKRMLVQVLSLNEDQLRVLGVTAVAIGVGLVWVAKVFLIG